MKSLLSFLLIALLLFGCDKETKAKKIIKEIPVKLTVDRFDQALFESKPADLGKLKKQFPSFFPSDVPDSVWINKIQNPLWRELYNEVQKKYENFDAQTNEIGSFLQHVKYYFPKTKTPKITTLVYEMDYNTKAIYADSIILIPLEMYLGKTHKFYEFPAYQKQNLEPSQIVPDLADSFAQTKIRPSADKTLLSLMIQAGKALYLKDLLIPELSDADKIGYTLDQLKFCVENESFIWAFFVEKNLLFNNDSKLANRFINPAPFSKFYLEIDNETPGRIGTWTGWQIVKSYAKNNPDIKIQQLLNLDAETIFTKSKYKPKKI